MADFDANLIASPDIIEGDANGGNADAILLVVPALLFQAYVGGGTVSARFMFFGAAAGSVNRVYDSVAAKFITWPSEAPDAAGTQYPGPGVYGANTSDYVLLSSC